MSRLVKVGVIALAIVVGSLPNAGAGPKKSRCAEPNQIIKRDRNWTTIKLPPFPPQPVIGLPGAGQLGQQMSASNYAIDPLDPNRIVVTNQEVVMGTVDGGCTWKEEYKAPQNVPGADVPLNRPANVKDLQILSGPGLERRTLMLTSTNGVGLLISKKDGGPYEEPSSVEGGRFLGSNPAIAVAPSDPKTVYLTTNLYSTFNLLYLSHDGGDNWSLKASYGCSASRFVHNDRSQREVRGELRRLQDRSGSSEPERPDRVQPIRSREIRRRRRDLGNHPSIRDLGSEGHRLGEFGFIHHHRRGGIHAERLSRRNGT